MDHERKLAVLTDLAESLGFSVRLVGGWSDSANHPGGAVVRLKGRDVIFLNPLAGVADRISVLAEALRGRAEIEEMYLPPEVRDAIDGGTGL